MRTFYIFKINRELAILTKEIPYNLFKTIDNLFYLDSFNMGISNKMYHNIFLKFEPDYVNKRINSLFKNNRFYSYDGSVHTLNNKYRPENSTLKVYKTHIILKTDAVNPSLLVNFLSSDNLFVCDFKNRDYFWLNQFVR